MSVPAVRLALERRPCDRSQDPWRLHELEPVQPSVASGASGASGTGIRKSRTKEVMSLFHELEPEVLEWRVCLGLHEDYCWAAFRRRFGQPRSIITSFALHGLREMPFHCQLSFMAIVCEYTAALLALLLGPGYMRGLSAEPMTNGRVMALFFWPAPLEG